MRHFETKHGDLKRVTLEYFERKLSDLSASRGQTMSFSGANMKPVGASYRVSLRTAKAGKPHTVGESLLLPAAKDMASAVKERLTERLKLLNIVGCRPGFAWRDAGTLHAFPIKLSNLCWYLVVIFVNVYFLQ
jgi:hypothetical protein